MRLSVTAEHDQPLRLYVLADHRVDVSSAAPAGAPSRPVPAGWLPAT